MRERRGSSTLAVFVGLLLTVALPAAATELFGVVSGTGPATFGDSAVTFSGSGADDLLAIDSPTGTVTAVGTGLPSGMRNFNSALDTAGGRYFYQTDAGLHVVDSATGALLVTHPLAENVAGLEYEPLGDLLYGVVLGLGPGTFGASLVLDGSGANDFVSIDPATGAVALLASGLPSGMLNFGAAVDSAGGRYFYTTDGALHVVDLATGAVAASHPLAENLHGLRWDPVSGLLFGLVLGPGPAVFGPEMAFTGSGANDFVAIDAATGAVALVGAGLPSGEQNFAAALDPAAGEYFYRTGGDLVTVDLATGAATTSVAAPDNYYALEAPFVPAPEVVEVAIDVKPGSDPNSINPGSKGVIPVAILTTSVADGDALDFDAADVDPASLAFGPGAAPIARPGSFEDVDGDGDLDLVVHFRTQAAAIACGDTTVSLTGMTFDAQPIAGSDAIRTVGCS
ncbi:MAG: hypothetical protein ACRD2T_11990 [Thermoanaerobaculia bacterium]